ncbi:hypothetical protein CAPTEDRAFT_101331 [Capitella teleta]|uniref:Cupin-like domain-containing protein n=1 Tax=Capitella teleta TaxID=283909 RepID=R7TA74_CAPTE|nr:hypothetical protein CAPTEDRAFT_101331 [Capitella teleta]|eukprot:ELT90614.1 hypothetical protein CAPTEDRAFT_101331 [Capitella teleta]
MRFLLEDHIRRPEIKSNKSTDENHNVTALIILYTVLAILCAVFGGYLFGPRFIESNQIVDYVETIDCLIGNNEYLMEVSRPIFDCDVCRHLKTFPIVNNITEEEFSDKYAYSAVPVLVKNAVKDWSAMETFSYDYFKEIYTKDPGIIRSVEEECQFFPYSTEFRSLGELFQMQDARAQYESGEKPWYVGWSNCNHQVQEELRKHYHRPHFLPTDAESSAIDWIFMGGRGLGAAIHLDSVRRPSWQAQIQGSKTWHLVPPPECQFTCSPLKVHMAPGDIIVVDTNQWYHSTFIHDGNVSITIGSEYD